MSIVIKNKMRVVCLVYFFALLSCCVSCVLEEHLIMIYIMVRDYAIPQLLALMCSSFSRVPSCVNGTRTGSARKKTDPAVHGHCMCTQMSSIC